MLPPLPPPPPLLLVQASLLGDCGFNKGALWVAAHLLLQEDATITAHTGGWLCGGLHMELNLSSVAPSAVLGGAAGAQPMAWPDCALLCGAT